MKQVRTVLVDDSPVFLASASELLQEIDGVELVGTATTGAQALLLIERAAPELALVDLNMPGMNGLETARRAKALHGRLRVILISVQESADFACAARAAGADAFVLKHELAEALTDYLAQWFGPKAHAPSRPFLHD